MKKLLLVLFLCLSVADVLATQVSCATFKGTTWGTTDTCIANANFTIDTSVSIGAMWFPAGQTYTLTKSGTRTLTLNNNGIMWKDSSSGSKTYPDSIAMLGNGSAWLGSATGGTVTGGTTVWYMGGSTDSLCNNRISTTFKRLHIKKLCSFYGGTGNVGFNASEGYPFYIEDSVTYNYVTGSVALTRSTNGDFHHIGSGVTMTTHAMTFNVGGTGTKVNFPGINISNCNNGNMYFRSDGTNDTMIVTGNITLTGCNFNGPRSSSATVQLYWDLNDYNYTTTAGNVGFGTSFAHTTGTDRIYWGNGTIKFKVLGYGADSNGTKTSSQIFFEGAKFIQVGSGNIILPKNDSINPGTSTVWTTATTSLTSNSQSLYDLRDSLGALTMTGNYNILNDFTILSGNSSAYTQSGRSGTIGGDLVDNGTGTKNYGTGFTFPNASSLFQTVSASGAITGSSCAITWNGTSGTLDDDKGVTFDRFTNSGSVTFTGNGQSNFTTSTAGVVTFLLNNGSTTTINGGGFIARRQLTGRTFEMIGDAVLNGNATCSFRITSASSYHNDTVKNLHYTGTGSFIFIDTSLTVPSSLNFVDTCDIGNNLLSLYGSTSGVGNDTVRFVDNCYVKCDSLYLGYGNNVAGYRDFVFNNSKIYTRALKIYVTGGSSNISPGTSTIYATGTGTWTTIGKHFWVMKIACASATNRVTLVDSVQCDSAFIDSTGKLAVGANTIRTKNYTNISPDSMTSTGNLILTGYFSRNTTASYATGGRIMFDTSTNRNQTFTATNAQVRPIVCKWLTFLDSAKVQKLTISNGGKIKFTPAVGVKIDTIGKFSGAVGALDSFVSTTPGSQARLWVPGNSDQTYMYWKDICVQGGIITCPWANGCRSGGGGKCP